MKHPAQIRSYSDDVFRIDTPPKDAMYDQDARDIADKCRWLARAISSSAFDNLDTFPYVYFTSGITGALDYLLPRKRFKAHEKEYRYVFSHNSVLTSQSAKEADSEYLTYPRSFTGAFNPIVSSNREILLDCAYIFATHLKHHQRLIPEKVSEVMFSLSKSHNLYDYRIGWFFSKTRYSGIYDLQYTYAYLPHNILPILQHVNKFPANHLYDLNKETFSQKFKENGLTESDTNLFAFTNTGNRIPFYML